MGTAASIPKNNSTPCNKVLQKTLSESTYIISFNIRRPLVRKSYKFYQKYNSQDIQSNMIIDFESSQDEIQENTNNNEQTTNSVISSDEDIYYDENDIDYLNNIFNDFCTEQNNHTEQNDNLYDIPNNSKRIKLVQKDQDNHIESDISTQNTNQVDEKKQNEHCLCKNQKDEENQQINKKMQQEWQYFKQTTKTFDIFKGRSYRKRLDTHIIQQQGIGEFFLSQNSTPQQRQYGSENSKIHLKQEQKQLETWEKMVNYGEKKRQKYQSTSSNSPQNKKQQDQIQDIKLEIIKTQSEQKPLRGITPDYKSQNNNNHRSCSEKMQNYQQSSTKTQFYYLQQKKTSNEINSLENSKDNIQLKSQQNDYEFSQPIILDDDEQVKSHLLQKNQSNESQQQQQQKTDEQELNKNQKINSLKKLKSKEIHYDLSIFKFKKQTQFRRCIRAGPPMKYRWPAWKAWVIDQKIKKSQDQQISEEQFQQQKFIDLQELDKIESPEQYRNAISQYPNKLQIYEFLIQKMKSTSEQQIQKDIHRTFPLQKYFQQPSLKSQSSINQDDQQAEIQQDQSQQIDKNQDEFADNQVLQDKNQYDNQENLQNQKMGQKSLYRVLKATSIYFKNVGYCQGMNFICAFMLLINGGNEVEAFEVFTQICVKYHFIAIFEQGFPLYYLLEFIFQKYFKQKLPKLFKHFEDNTIIPTSYLFNWFETVFLYTFPFEIAVRIWDYFISQGLFGILDISIAILIIFENDLKKLEDNEINLFFQDQIKTLAPVSQQEFKKNSELYPDMQYCLDPEKLIQTAKKYRINKKEIKNFTLEYFQQEGNQNILSQYSSIKNLYEEIQNK